MTKQERIAAFVERELQRDPPRSQEAGCRLAARASIHVGDAPETDDEFIEAAAGMAQGLFGPAFDRADEGQKSLWMLMCEDALRQEVAKVR